MTIYKYEFAIDDRVTISLPKSHRILKVEKQYNQDPGRACLWVLVDTESRMEENAFRIYGTGHPIDRMDIQDHVATWQAPPFVWHMFRAAN
jgi:hypothetical protein